MLIENWSYRPEYAILKEEILQALEAVFDSGRLILGPKVEEFEKNFSAYCGSYFGIGVNSGTDALFLALKALKIVPGDEVITVANTAVPTVAAIRACGAIPVFVDIDKNYYLMDVAQLESVITKKTKAILPVLLYGQSVDLEPLLGLAKKKKLAVVEDCAQSHGCRYQGKMTGSFGDVGAFSFYPTKVLGGYGDGGMCVTSQQDLAERLMQLRMYGMKGEYYSYIEGYNSRLDEMQAAILSVKLKYLEKEIAERRRIAHIYSEELCDYLMIPTIAPHSDHVYYLYVVRHPDRDHLVRALSKAGIQTRIHFPYPIHLMEAYQWLGYGRGDLPVTEMVAKEIFSLPLYSGIPTESIEKVIQTLKQLLH